MLASVRPRDIAGKTRRSIATEELADLIAIETKMKKAAAELKAMVRARESHLMDVHEFSGSVGPAVTLGEGGGAAHAEAAWWRPSAARKASATAATRRPKSRRATS